MGGGGGLGDEEKFYVVGPQHQQEKIRRTCLAPSNQIATVPFAVSVNIFTLEHITFLSLLMVIYKNIPIIKQILRIVNL